MKQTAITVTYDEEKISALKMYLAQKEQSVEDELEKALETLYKVMQDEDLLILGYQPDEDGVPKDLILGYYDDNGKLQCRGKVYLGVSKEERAIILKFAKKNAVKQPWFEKYKNIVWLKPELMGTVQYMHETESGGMRQPVWKGLRDDK